MGYVDEGVPMEPSKKRKTRGDGLSVAETLAKWRYYNAQLESSELFSKGPKKGKGGPDNSQCNFRGVKQRTWGKWVAEIREPNRGKKLWLGTFNTADDAASAYDEAARAMYAASARLNFPESVSTMSGPPPAGFEASADESTCSLVKDESTDNGQEELLAFSENELFDAAELMALLEDNPFYFTDSVLDFGFDVNQLGFPDTEADMPSLVDTEGKDEQPM